MSIRSSCSELTRSSSRARFAKGERARARVDSCSLSVARALSKDGPSGRGSCGTTQDAVGVLLFSFFMPGAKVFTVCISTVSRR